MCCQILFLISGLPSCEEDIAITKKKKNQEKRKEGNLWKLWAFSKKAAFRLF